MTTRTFDLTGVEAVLQLETEVQRAPAPYLAWGYRARLQGHSLQVTLSIGDDNPASFAEFFESLARDWQGWSEIRAYESLDGTLSITALHDGQRAIRFEVKLRADSRSGFDWSAAHRLTVDATQLKAIASVASTFAA